MGEGASFALGPPSHPPQRRGGLVRFATTGAPAAWARGPPSLWDHRGPRRKGEVASFALGPPGPRRIGEVASFRLGPPGPPPHGRGGLLRFGTAEASAAWARGPPSICDYPDPHRIGEGTPFALESPRPPPQVRGDLPRFGTILAPTAWARVPPSL